MNKKCLKARELMTLLTDNKIDDVSLEWFRKHLSSCDNCAKELSNLQEIKRILKKVKQENLPPDFYFKLNRSLDMIEEKQKNKGFFQNLQLVFRTGLIFAIVILGFIVTFRVVKNKIFISPALEEKPKIEIAELKKIENISEEKEEIQSKLEVVDKKTALMPVQEPQMAIRYQKPSAPYSLISTGQQGYQSREITKRIYMQPIPVKSYYELNQGQIQNRFDLKVFKFIVDDKETWEKIKVKYNINEFPIVNFQTEMVVLLVAEDSTNYGVEIINALKEINKLVIFYRLNSGENLSDSQTTSKNYDIKIISKTQLPVIFQRIE